ncbi:SLC13 family permease [Frigidibacter albus]|uniref:SLC13 family permease n=1 Tax=Frigidibacter albus TaxID=1465486 RepID=A0A6L8VI11_9RHOB|nr:SLC13 family permease [Frigidibacter albus]MZQ88969.1 SLC13 family permease [Frigidibacter albus]NBE30974.1 SLC13 family permease [Frigidibacter albus]GGH52162.1 sodium:sulfate symporter [Frigidibacter albus]
MFDLALSPPIPAILALAIVSGMFVLFVTEIFPTEVVAIAGAALMLVTGLLPYNDAVAVLSNTAPWTIAFMFLIMGGLVRTGALDGLTRVVERQAGSRPKLTIVLLFGFVVVASGFMNNTPVVAVMIPVVIQIARKLSISPSKLLMPLSYFTIMGGMLTLIGTSTNLLVDGVARDRGLAHFSIFEIAPLGIAVALSGAVFMALFADKLLPDRVSMSDLLAGRRAMKYFTEVAVPEDSDVIGTPVLDVPLFKREGIRVIDVLRGDASLRRDMASAVLAAGDRVVLRTEMADLLDLQQSKTLRLVDKLSSVQTETVEVLISPGCRMIGRTLGELRLRRRYGVYVLAAHRRNQNIGRQLDDLEVRVGDTLLLEGAAEDIQRLAMDMELVDVSRPTAKPFRRRNAPIAVGALVAVVVLAGLEVAPILALAAVAVAVILITQCIDADEAFSFIDGRLLALIFAMLAVGAALDHSGAVTLIVDAVAPWLMGLSPFLTILCVYFLGQALTELLSNNAVAVILTPIAIELAATLGMDPRPFVVAVMFSASVAFATPIGYQTNTMVYGPGGYRFTDYMRLGLPLNIVTGLVACALIPLLWPL